MDGVATGLLLATLAGLSIPLGAALAMLPGFRPNWLDTRLRHTVTAFGGGALFSAIAFVLIPQAAARLPAFPLLAAFLIGGLVFFAVDHLLARHGGKGTMLLAMLLDFIPEAMALGALIAGQPDVALLTAAIIALQNLPEGFSAYRELAAKGTVARRRLLLVFVLLVPIGPAAAAIGLFVLNDQPAILGLCMAFAAGGILYLLFEDVAPAAQQKNAAAPALGAVAGFALGLAGHLAIT